MAIGYEPGYKGNKVSLGGIVGRYGLGLKIERPDTSLTLTSSHILRPNQARAWAMIQNTGETNDLTISLDEGTGVTPAFVLKPGGVFQIDVNCPWTGAVYGASTTTTVEWLEASVQE